MITLKELVSKGVGVAARDEHGATVVHHAAATGSMAVLKFIVDLHRVDFLNIPVSYFFHLDIILISF